MKSTLSISAALGEMLVPGRVFSIGARKKNGDWTEKAKCVLVHNSRGDLNQRKYWSRNGLLKLREVGGKHEFNIYIDLLVEFNGQEINWEA
jgi:hypothetical protein